MMMTEKNPTDAVMNGGTTGVDDEEIPDADLMMDIIVEIPTLLPIDRLSDEVLSKILVEYVGFDIGLINLASTSKFWSDVVYRKTPGLWKKIVFSNNSSKLKFV
jgi:hypothetical protein